MGVTLVKRCGLDNSKDVGDGRGIVRFLRGERDQGRSEAAFIVTPGAVRHGGKLDRERTVAENS